MFFLVTLSQAVSFQFRESLDIAMSVAAIKSNMTPPPPCYFAVYIIIVPLQYANIALYTLS